MNEISEYHIVAKRKYAKYFCETKEQHPTFWVLNWSSKSYFFNALNQISDKWFKNVIILVQKRYKIWCVNVVLLTKLWCENVIFWCEKDIKFCSRMLIHWQCFCKRTILILVWKRYNIWCENVNSFDRFGAKTKNLVQIENSPKLTYFII